jgi:hypothetical protein
LLVQLCVEEDKLFPEFERIMAYQPSQRSLLNLIGFVKTLKHTAEIASASEVCQTSSSSCGLDLLRLLLERRFYPRLLLKHLVFPYHSLHI